MTSPENPRFAANIANRVWKKVFGLAVQEPVADLDDPAKASNPALLAHLATIIKYGRFDLREFPARALQFADVSARGQRVAGP